MNAFQALLLISITAATTAVSLVVMLFGEPSLQFETTVTVILIYFVIAFFGYMRSYAHELRQRREPFVP